jgi:hypothetical protein
MVAALIMLLRVAVIVEAWDAAPRVVVSGYIESVDSPNSVLASASARPTSGALSAVVWLGRDDPNLAAASQALSSSPKRVTKPLPAATLEMLSMSDGLNMVDAKGLLLARSWFVSSRMISTVDMLPLLSHTFKSADRHRKHRTTRRSSSVAPRVVCRRCDATNGRRVPFSLCFVPGLS